MIRHRLLPLALLALALAGVAPAAAAQSNAERILNDAYTRSHDYDLVHQRIELSAFDWDSTRLDGRVTTTLVSRRVGLDSVILDAGAGLAVRAVTAAGSALRFDRVRDTLVVRLARPAGFGDTVRFTVDYRAAIESGRGLTFIEADSVLGRPRQLWSQGQADNNHHWFPTYDFPNDKATWEIVATVPAGFDVVSNGRRVADSANADGTRTVHWRQERPTVTYLASIIVAPLVRIEDRWRDVPVEYYVYPGDSALAEPLFSVTPDMMEVFSRLTGVDYPWVKYAQTTVADFFGGMENVSASTMVDWLPDERAFLDRVWYHHILIPHELAHQWFGDLVTTENWANMWLNEGFAEFMPCQYWGVKHGPRAEEDCYLADYGQFMRIDARRRMPLASLGSNNIYPKGALVLEMLKRHLGPERFWASVERYLERHAYDNAVSDDFRQAILDATGQNLDWFFDQWVYKAGYPAFTVTAGYDTAAAVLRLDVRQTQRDTAAADSTGLRFETPEVFRMPLTVVVGTGEREVAYRVWIEQREQTVEIPLDAAPTMVVFDAHDEVLKTLEFEQPTAWLAELLRRHDVLWNQWWAIQQLRTRTDDPAAARALARTIRTAPWFSTRAEAASALARFSGREAERGLMSAINDSSAAVRSAAAAALGQVGGRHALRLVRRAWDRDPSYAVRAAALGALTRLDSAGARDLIIEGLRTGSYRDVIANAALGALVRHPAPDSALLTAGAAALERQELAALAFAAMAVRGNERALELLTDRLDHERAVVRRWALQGFRNGMPREVAVPALRAALGSLARPEAKIAVTRTLEQLEQPSPAH